MTIRNGAASFLGHPLTANYRPSIHGWSWGLWQSGQRGFVLQDVELMRRDARVQLNLRVLAAPLFRQKWVVNCPRQDVADFYDKQLKRFWRHDLVSVLRMLAWGFCPGEPLYRLHEGMVQFDRLKDIHPLDATPMDTAGKITGIKVRGLGDNESLHPPILRRPRQFWATLEPEYGVHFGRSRLAGAWDSWMEKTGRHGARESRRLWYVKNAFRGGTIRHPPGMIELDAGAAISAQDYARELLEKFENGGILVLPNAKDPDSGEYLWVYEPPAGNGEMKDIREYPKDLDLEMTQGMGILPEVIQASSAGSGWAGRSVPFLVFLTAEDQIAMTVIDAFDWYIGRDLVNVNFGPVDYEIEPVSLTTLADDNTQPGQAAGQEPHPEDLNAAKLPDEGDPAMDNAPEPRQLQLSRGDDYGQVDEQLWQQCLALIPKEQPTPDQLPLQIGQIDDATVFIVDGNEVKIKYDMDFVEAANDLARSFVPKEEIWIDDGIHILEMPFNVYHEARERRFMKTGLTYEHAHQLVNAQERILRQREPWRSAAGPPVTPRPIHLSQVPTIREEIRQRVAELAVASYPPAPLEPTP